MSPTTTLVTTISTSREGGQWFDFSFVFVGTLIITIRMRIIMLIIMMFFEIMVSNQTAMDGSLSNALVLVCLDWSNGD